MKLFNLSLLGFVLLFSCSEKVTEAECPAIMCTQEFRSVSVLFKDAAGNPTTVNDFKAVVRRTGKSIQAEPVDTVNFKGYYPVVTDGHRKQLSTTGDTIDVSAVHPLTNQKKTAQFVVSGGRCACHIEKISGPEEITFN